jgi:hypothetical protein
MNENEKLKEIETLCTYLLGEIKAAKEAKYDEKKAERTAAGFLEAQMELSKIIPGIELKAALLDPLIKKIKADAYVKFKGVGAKKSEGGVSDATAKEMVATDQELLDKEQERLRLQSEYNKWKYIFDTLKEGHFFFKDVSRGKNNWS